jgi:hypothetical protein
MRQRYTPLHGHFGGESGQEKDVVLLAPLIKLAAHLFRLSIAQFVLVTEFVPLLQGGWRVLLLGATLPLAKRFRRFCKAFTLDWASDQVRVSKDHLFW